MPVKENVKNNKWILKLSNIISTPLFWILSFSILTVFAAQVSVPVKPVPFTLQTMLVLLSGAFLGARNGALSQVIYLAAGSIGLPVFANFNLGIAVLFGPTGVYLVAFPVAAYLVGKLLEQNKSLFMVAVSMVLGTLLILLSGAAYLSLFFDGILKKHFLPVLLFSPDGM
ncbi:MAG: biotin transporter BioY [Melioribacteraceae bacterium]|nr:biotin transporter BioY [Melioribacteraceae bacterium]